MKVTISATAPTTYQLNSLRAFGMGINKNGNGSYSASLDFETIKEAKDYLVDRANNYFENPKELAEAKRKIRLYGVLQLDAVQARIDKKETN